MALTQQQYNAVLTGAQLAGVARDKFGKIENFLNNLVFVLNPDPEENPMGQDWTAQRAKELYGPVFDAKRAQFDIQLAEFYAWYDGL